MKKYTVSQLRELYLSFFESKNHLRLPSFSLIPKNDNSLLLINSGMAPLKPYFTGQEKPPRNRVTTCQKCIRTGDIDNIGHTARHGTFFEMLGNFSFGDYFKKEAISWSWEFLTEVVGMDRYRLYPSVYVDDKEAFDLWHDYIGIPSERIFKFGKEDNFWEHGAGPCGPCSEIYYDRGEKYGCGKENCTVGCDCDRYMEVWNNVFTQFNNDGKGNYTELKNKNIDTGMGLERLALAVQDVDSIFDVDTNKELMDEISLLTGILYKDDEILDISFRIIADHIKSCTFMVSDGILPSNEGRGYVLRRLLRRAVQHGKKLKINKTFMSKLAKVVIKLNESHYHELKDRESMIFKVIDNEEEKFSKTLDQGLEILNQYSKELIDKNEKKLLGDKAFKLYDTYGFPIDLTKEILKEKNILVDDDGFNELMKEQKDKARIARKTTNYMGADVTVFNQLSANIETKFVGYDKTVCKSKVVAIALGDNLVNELNEGDEGVIIVEETPFYSTMGGQVGDIGYIKNDNGVFKVNETIKVLNTKVAHIGSMINGQLVINDKVELEVDEKNRLLTSANHTATHLLQASLREVLGKHVEQAGSMVDSEKLRFDFTHFSPLSSDEIKKVEDIVNSKIDESISVIKKEMKLEDAKKEGAMALFGEKYSDVVRTVKVGDFSFELCGGTHIDNTSSIKYFKIIEEVSVAQGVRRIVAITNNKVIDYFKDKNKILVDIENMLKTNDNAVLNKVSHIVEEVKEYKNKIEELKKQDNNKKFDFNVKSIKDLDVVISFIDNCNINALKAIADDIKSKYKNYFTVLLGFDGDKSNLVVSISEKAVSMNYSANDIIKKLSDVIDGKGGGSNKFAQAVGKKIDNVNILLDRAEQMFS